MTNDNGKICPICKLKDQRLINTSDAGERRTYGCARCGNFTITRTAETMAERKEIGHQLSSWIRDHYERKQDLAEINSNTLKTLESDLPKYTPAEKQLILLRNIERKSEYPGFSVELHRNHDYPLAWASCPDEFLHYILSLIERKLLRTSHGSKINLGEWTLDVELTSDGWNYLEEKAKQSTTSTQAFIAMSFSEEIRSVWENAIRPAVVKAGYKPYRVDSEPHIDRIDAKIMSEIKNSRFVVADVTGQKHGVYFEAGYALGLNLPVIWACNKEDINNVHFDTRQYNHILWSTEQELEEQLYYVIDALIGKP